MNASCKNKRSRSSITPLDASKQTTHKLRDIHAKRSRSRAGSTFIEAIIAVSILAMFSTGTSRLLVSHRALLDMARNRYTAGNLAKNRLELVRTFDFEQIPEMEEIGIRIDGNGMPSTEGDFLRVTSVSPLSANLYELTVSVKIKNRKTLDYGPAEEVVYTYVAKHL